MFHKDGNRRRTWRGRAFSLFLAAALLLGSVPGFVLPASAHWADSYLDQLVDWGVMRADQTAKPDTPLTRAEFMAIINRAYGYKEMGPIPFEDVSEGDWFYDDVAIAYNAGYMKGTSKTTASPNARLTREQAICILGRNMMLKETPGEDMAFTDSRSISNWAKGMVKTAVNNYIVTGYPDDTFRPKDNITKGQMAVLVAQCVGNPVSQSGAYELGDVSGNLTITAPNVTLRNTTVSGDLYVSGGVGLGGIKLENVNVLGRIVVSGTGESEAGDASVVMRNVTANEMLVDNMRNKTVTLRADGITEIPKTIVRTSAYLEDNNTDDKGLMSIELDGDSGSQLTLAGRIKEVIDKTPNSLVQVAKGTVAKLTVDEAAVNANVQLDRNTVVREMNLDVASNVTGDGDIDQLNVNAPGCVVSMLPDKIYIRPGITGNIGGIIMDHTDAEEGSLDPRLLSGYPAAKDITPTGLRADFSGNKKGTVYWAVSSITDGSIGEDDLISPPSYGSKAIRNGSVALPTGGSEVSAQVTGLTVGGSYYLSAILVDDLGNRSPVKVVSFSTPDNTVPAFGQGYPYMSFVGKANEYDNGVTAQAAVMATKTCRMYYAVLPAGAAAPTTDELRSASVSANLGYGVVELEKNYVWDGDRAIIVSRRLAEQKDYVLYLWLTDGVNNSEVTSLAFTTPDVTPPEFVAYPKVNGDAQAASVPMTATISEDGTIYWVAVKSGADYPLPNPGNDKENTEDGKTARLDSEYAKIQVANGMNAVSKGSVTAKANTPVNLNITGLQAETSYDVYFLIRDTAGNDARSVYKVQEGIRTLDTGNPTVSQSFTSVDSQDPTRPKRDTSIVLEFSENVMLNGRDLLSLYQDTQSGTTSEKETALDTFTKALRDNIDLEFLRNSEWHSGVRGNSGVSENDWVVDFSQARVANVDGKVRLTFPGGSDSLRLKNGGSYRFRLVPSPDEHPITDQSQFALRDPNAPPMEDKYKAVEITLDEFTVVFAQVNLFSDGFRLDDEEWPTAIKEENKTNQEGKVNIGEYKVDFKFRMSAKDTGTVADGIAYDLLLWSDTEMEYDLYYRAVSEKNDVRTAITAQPGFGMPNMPDNPDPNGWVKLGNSGRHNISSLTPDGTGKSLHCAFNGISSTSSGTLPQLNSLQGKTADGADIFYDFAISVRRLGGNLNPDAWSDNVTMYVDVAAGYPTNLVKLGNTESISRDDWRKFYTSGLNGSQGGESVGSVSTKSEQGENAHELKMSFPFSDKLQPDFHRDFPTFTTTEKEVTMKLRLDRPGHIFYIIGCASKTDHEDGKPEPSDTNRWVPSITTEVGSRTIRPEEVPTSGADRVNDNPPMPTLSSPLPENVLSGDILNENIIARGNLANSGLTSTDEPVSGLQPNTTYYAYFVITANGSSVPSEVQIYKFKTSPVKRPALTIGKIDGINGALGKATITSDMTADITYKIFTQDTVNGTEWPGTSITFESDLSEVMDNANDLPKGYKDISIYDALWKTYSYDIASEGKTALDGYFPTNGAGDPETTLPYSVFDVYASDSYKEALQDWLELNNQSTTAEGKEVRVTTLETDPCLARDKYYYVVAMAVKNPETNLEKDNPIGLRYSFKGEELKPGNERAPNLVDVAGGEFEVDKDGNIINANYRFTLIFDSAMKFDGKIPDDITDKDDIFFDMVGLSVGNIASVDQNTNILLIVDTGVRVSSISATTTAGMWTNDIGAHENKRLSISARATGKTVDDRPEYEIRVDWTGSPLYTLKGYGPKPPETPVPGTRGVATTFSVDNADMVDGTSRISFDAPLYAGEDTPVTSVQQLADIADEIKGIDLSQSQVITSEDGTTLVLKLKGKAEDVSLKIDGGKLTNSAGEAAQETLSVQIDKRVETNQSNMKLNSFYTDVSWGDQTWTDKGTNTKY